MLTITGKKQSTAAVAMRGAGESGSNQALKIGANAMIGIALAAIASGISASPRRRKRASTTAERMPSDEPITKPPSASFSVSQPALQSRLRCVQNDETIAHGFGSRNFWMLKTSIEICQTAIAAKKTTIAGTQSAIRLRTDTPGARARRRSCALLGEHRSVLVGADAAQQLAHLGHELEEVRVLARVVRARLRQVDVDHAGDRARGAGS